jgi:hypothetical protein
MVRNSGFRKADRTFAARRHEMMNTVKNANGPVCGTK